MKESADRTAIETARDAAVSEVPPSVPRDRTVEGRIDGGVVGADAGSRCTEVVHEVADGSRDDPVQRPHGIVAVANATSSRR